MFVSERMSTNLITVTPDVPIAKAKELMVKAKIRHLPVVDKEGKLVGIVSDRDMRDAMPSVLLNKDDYEVNLAKVGGFPVSAIMTKNPLSIYPSYTMQDILLAMERKKVGALPVIDEKGFLKGLVSTRDLLRAFVNVLNIEEAGTLLCVVVEQKPGQMKRVIDVIAGENISLGSVLVARDWDKNKRVIFPYLLTNNVMNVKKKLLEQGFQLLDPMSWYMEQVPHT